MRERRITVFDVFDNFLGEPVTPGAVRDLHPRQVRDLAEHLGRYYSSWTLPTAGPHEFRVCPSTIGEYHLSPGLRSKRPGRAHRGIRAWMLYADSAVTMDPFSMVRPWIWQASGRPTNRIDIGLRSLSAPPSPCEKSATTVRQARRFIAQALDETVRYRDLVQQGALILLPDLVGWTTFENQALEEFEVDAELPDVDILGFDTALQYAASQSLRFLPEDAEAWQYMQYRLARANEELAPAEVELHVLPALITADLPWAHIDPRTLAQIRQDDQSFELWRIGLRTAIRTISTLPTDSRFARDAQSALADFVNPTAAALRTSMSRMTQWRHAAYEGVARLTIGAVYGGGLGMAAGGSLRGALAGASTGALTSATIAMLFREHPAGAASVLAQIIEGEQ